MPNATTEATYLVVVNHEEQYSIHAADGGLPVPDALAEGALAIYARLLAGGAGARKEDALPLLAADALFTHALEAQAEIDPDGVAALAERIGAAGALAGLAG